MRVSPWCVVDLLSLPVIIVIGGSLIYLTEYKFGKIYTSRTDPQQLKENINTTISKLECLDADYAKEPLPRIALASFPGSGNTWIRHMIQQATGIYTGSIYDNDVKLRKGAFPAEGITNESVIVVKTHEWGMEPREEFDKVILLVRDPAEALLAEFHRRFGGHTGHAGRFRFLSNDWPAWFKRAHACWAAHTVEWLKFRGPIHLVFHNKLKENTANELEKVLQFVQMPASKKNIKCAILKSQNRHRRRKKNLGFNPYTKMMNRTLDRYRKIVKEALHGHKCWRQGLCDKPLNIMIKVNHTNCPVAVHQPTRLAMRLKKLADNEKFKKRIHPKFQGFIWNPAFLNPGAKRRDLKMQDSR